MAVHELTNFIVSNLDDKKKTIAIFLDLAKAFDTVSVPILLHKLESLGIRGKQFLLFKDYLTDRTQFVKIDDQTSDNLPVTVGVPQGSILGPTLFLVYINDLCNLHLQNGRLITFADDTALLFGADSWESVYRYAQAGFSVVHDWLKNNILTLNSEKTKFITFTLKNNQQPSVQSFTILAHTCPFPLSGDCSCSKLQKVDTIRYLGVTLDSRLTFDAHISSLTNRIRKFIFIFRNLRSVLNFKQLISVYCALCRSLLTYCITSWGGTYKTTLLPLERAQRAVLKVALSLPFRHPTKDVYNLSNVLSVRQLFILHVALKQRSLIPVSVCHKNIDVRKRRRNVCTSRPVKTKFARNFFIFLGPFLYNKLNNLLSTHILGKTTFKKTLTTWLLSLDYAKTEDLFTTMS